MSFYSSGGGFYEIKKFYENLIDNLLFFAADIDGAQERLYYKMQSNFHAVGICV